MNAIMHAKFVIIIFWSQINAKILIEDVKTNGILIKQMGDVYEYGNVWNVFSGLDVKAYREEEHVIRAAIEQIVECKNKLKDADVNTLNVLVNELEKLLNAIEQVNLIIGGDKKLRKKRTIAALILPAMMGAGMTLSVYNTIGLQQIKSQMEIMKKENNEILQLQKNQTLIVMDLVKTMEEESEGLMTNLNNVKEKIKKMREKSEDAALLNQIVTVAQITTVTAVRYTNYQGALINKLLMDDYANLSPELISFSKMEKLKNNIERLMDANHMFPTGLLKENEAVNLYKIVKMKTYVTDGQIIFDIIIPTITRMKKQILKLVVAPVPTEDGMYFVEPRSPYVIINDLHNEISYLEEDEFKNCIKTCEKNYVCPNDRMTILIDASRPECEVEILLKTGAVENSCIRRTTGANLIINKLEENKYYIATRSELQIKTVCEGKSEIKPINGTGLITITGGCSILNSRFRITSTNFVNENETTEYIPSGLIPNKLFKKEGESNGKMDEQKIKNKYKLIELKLETEKNEEDKLENEMKGNVGSNGTMIIIIIILATTTMVGLVKIIMISKNRQKENENEIKFDNGNESEEKKEKENEKKEGEEEGTSKSFII